MDDTLRLIRERLLKAETKASRAEKTWDSAKKELEELQIALRVMRGLAGETNLGSSNTGDRQGAILALLQMGQENSVAPADLFESYKIMEEEQINIDTFRTTIWRMKDKDFHVGNNWWLVKSDSGKYWKEPVTFQTKVRHASPQESTPSGSDATTFSDFDDSEPDF